MPTGLRRYYGDDHLHFLTCSCYHRQRCLGSATGRDLFLRIFEQARQRYRFVVVGYVVMPDHIHLLISEPERARPRRSCGGETTVCAASAAQEEVKTASFRKVRERMGHPPLRLARNGGGALAEAWEGVREKPHFSQRTREMGHPAILTGHIMCYRQNITFPLPELPSAELTCGARKSDHRSETYVR